MKNPIGNKFNVFWASPKVTSRVTGGTSHTLENTDKMGAHQKQYFNASEPGLKI